MGTVVHVGFHRTATTMLQRQFFPSLPGCTVVAPGSRESWPFVTWARALCTADEYDDAKLRTYLASRRRPASTLIISLEDFSRLHADGRTPARLRRLLPDARILICVRDQRTALESMYSLHVRHGGTLTRAEYARRRESWFHYDVVVADYIEHFGADRVKVMPFEGLVEHPRRFLGEIRDFVAPGAGGSGAEITLRVMNHGMVPPVRWVLRHANRLFVESDEHPRPVLGHVRPGSFVVNKLLALDRVLAENPRLARLWRRIPQGGGVEGEWLATRCAPSNQRLARLTGLPLSRYGYDLGPDVVADFSCCG